MRRPVTLPESAEPYWLQQQAINAAAVAIAARAWQNSGGDPARWESALPLLMATIKRAQAAAALLAPKYVNNALRELSIPGPPVAVIDPAPLIGLSGSGLPLEDLYAELPNQLALKATSLARSAAELDVDDELPDDFAEPLTPAEVEQLPPAVVNKAMDATSQQLQAHVQTAISDTGRAAESLEIAVRPSVAGYVRMLNPPSCKRCVILAGKLYRWNAGFERHPRCDCRHIPANESVADDLVVDPNRYFRSLTRAEQDSAFTKAGAQAIRDGADIAQVVNADQGMQVAQVYGKNLKITLQGVTKRGRAGKAILARGRRASTTPRLMPSSIYHIAEDRADALRLLRLNGYIADTVVDLDSVLARSSA